MSEDQFLPPEDPDLQPADGLPLDDAMVADQFAFHKKTLVVTVTTFVLLLSVALLIPIGSSGGAPYSARTEMERRHDLIEAARKADALIGDSAECLDARPEPAPLVPRTDG